MNPIRIEPHPYQLKYKNSDAFRTGVLLKIHYDNGAIGYSDCHVWEEIGDLPLHTHLDLLKDNILTEITKPTLYFAKVDARARMEKIPLFLGEQFPLSHYIVSDLLDFGVSDLKKISQEGFSHIKIKFGKKIDQEFPKLKSLFQSPIAIKFRIDSNENLERNQFRELLRELSPWHSKIDFWEDPYSYNPEEWTEDQKEFSVALACDRRANYAAGKPEVAKVIVVKPAVDLDIPYNQIQDKQRIVLTSYLGHPIGQSAAACASVFLAHKYKIKIDVCGFMSHRVYEKNAFSELLSWNGPQWHPPKGTGLGFDDQLNSLKWFPL